MTKITEKTTCISREEKNGITQDLLREWFDYKDGFLYWKIRPTANVQVGSKAGCLGRYQHGNRYTIGINKKTYYSSRLIFFWHHGYLPKMVDHENRIKEDDRIENLRAATPTENSRNTSVVKNSSSKYLGVFRRDKTYRRFSTKYNEMRVGKERIVFESFITVNYKSIYLGVFEKESDASLAYNRAAVKYFGEFANLNIIKP